MDKENEILNEKEFKKKRKKKTLKIVLIILVVGFVLFINIQDGIESFKNSREKYNKTEPVSTTETEKTTQTTTFLQTYKEVNIDDLFSKLSDLKEAEQKYLGEELETAGYISYMSEDGKTICVASETKDYMLDSLILKSEHDESNYSVGDPVRVRFVVDEVMMNGYAGKALFMRPVVDNN